MSLKTLNEKSKEFKLPQENIDKRENDRLTFVSKFPIDSIKDLSIDEYVQGTDQNSFCYWLEFKNILFGIGGANASKFGIYKAKDGNYYTSYGKNKKLLSYDELNSLYNKIKAGLLQALEYTKNDEIDKIKSIDIPLWNMVLQKILSIYFPDKFITVGAPDVLIECARDIKLKGIVLKPENSIQINYECKKVLSSLPEYKDWPYEKVGSFIWQSYLNDSKRNYFIIGSKYDALADQNIFPEMLEKEVIATGYASHLNLEEFYLKNHSEITAYLSKQGEDSKSLNALKHFLSLKVGDRIAIKADGSPKGKKGFLSIVGLAEVVNKDGEIYRHDPKGLGHLINVNFLKAPIYREFDLGGYGRTIHKLSKPDHIDLLFKSEYPSVSIEHLSNIPREAKVIYSYLKKALSHRRIQKEILGENAPARGGGFLAMEILHSYEIEGDKKGILKNISYTDEYNKAKGKYLEALELIKGYYPEFNNGANKIIEMNHPLNTILYGPPGTGKTHNTVLRAAEIIEKRKINDYDEAKKIFKENLHNRIEFITFHQNYSYEDFIQGLRPDLDNHNLRFNRADGIFKQIVDRATDNNALGIGTDLKDYIIIKSNADIIELQRKKDGIIRYIPMQLITDLMNGIKNGKITLDQIQNRRNQDIHLADIIESKVEKYYFGFESSLYLICSLLLENQKKENHGNYVIIIDEINRANISRVFGELITLIEPDKRRNEKNQLEARLPSGEIFMVPSNLYIIGTMNTADKSIALLDIALRRRFEFESMYPKYEIEGQEIYDVEILKKINEKIINTKGHDFQIGHAYFMGENKNLVQRMNKKVIPLLLEYYMNDTKEVKEILLSAGLTIEEESWPLRIVG